MELFFAKILFFTIFAKKALSQMFDWVKNRLPSLQFKSSCDIIFEKVKGRRGKVNRTSIYAEAAVRRVL